MLKCVKNKQWNAVWLLDSREGEVLYGYSIEGKDGESLCWFMILDPSNTWDIEGGEGMSR